MVKVDTKQLENDYKVAKDLMGKNKYIQAVLHLENVLKRNYDESSKDMIKNIYRDIIFAYRTINNRTRADYYLTKAIGVFGSFDELELNNESQTKDLSEENSSENVSNDENENELENLKLENKLGEVVVVRNIEDFEILKKPYKIKANDTNEINFNNIFVEIFTAVESKKYFGYFKLNLNKLNDVLINGVENLEKDELIRLKWEIKTLLSLIDDNGITSFDALYRLEFEALFTGIEEETPVYEFEGPNTLELENNQKFSFKEENTEDTTEFNFENSSDNSEEIISGIDKIVEKNREIFEEHNNILGLDSEYTNTSDSSTDEIISTEETVHDLNMGISTEKNQSNHNETIIVEINTEKVKENNLEVSKVKDVVLEVLENLRKADLDIFTELKSQSEERAEKVGLEREMKGLVSGLEGMLEIKFGVASLDIVPEIKKINELEVLYEVKEKVLATRNFTDVEKLIEDSISQEG